MKKKAVTPLISSLLLIFFAIALGILVMSWGKADYSIKVPESCEKVGLRVISINEEIQACYKNDKIYFTAENDGEVELSGVKISLIGSDDIYQGELSLTMGTAEIKKLDAVYNKDIGGIMQLRLAPKINGKICTNKIFESGNIKECS